jgi:hypothetical protein
MLYNAIMKAKGKFGKLNFEVFRIIMSYVLDSLDPLVCLNPKLDGRSILHVSQLRTFDSFRLCVRKRPINHFESDAGLYDCITTNSLKAQVVIHDGRMARNGCRLSMTHHHYFFDRVWDDNTSNLRVCFDEIDPLLRWAKSGKNAALMCFGQVCNR